MSKLTDFRQKYPQYDDMDDEQLGEALHQKFYSDMPVEEFRAKIGLSGPSQRIAGAFEAAEPVRQVAKLVEPREGLLTSRNRFGDVGLSSAIKDIGGAFSTVGGIKRGEIPAMVPDTGQGVTNPQVEVAAKTLGAAALPINPAYRAGERAIPGVARTLLEKKVPPPTQEQLYKTGDRQFTEAFDMGVDYDPKVIANFASQARAHLDAKHYNDESAANTYAILKSLENPRGSFVPLEGFEHARRRLYDGATSPTDRKAGKIVADAIDRITENPPSKALLVRPAERPELVQSRAAAAGGILKEARGNWAAMERSKELAGRTKSAERRAKASNSGLNIDNTLRQRVATLRDQIDRGQIKGFSVAEIKAMDEFIVGKRGRNSMRFLANYLGGGGGLGTFASTAAGVGGLFAGHPEFLALPAAGLGLKVGQNVAGKRAMTKLDETVRKRSPLYQEQLAAAPAAPLSRMKPAIGLRAVGALGPVNPLTIYLSGGEERDRLLNDPRYRGQL